MEKTQAGMFEDHVYFMTKVRKLHACDSVGDVSFTKPFNKFPEKPNLKVNLS